MDKLSYGQFQPTHGIQNVVSILIFILSFLYFFTLLCVYRCMDVLEGGAVQCICGGAHEGRSCVNIRCLPQYLVCCLIFKYISKISMHIQYIFVLSILFPFSSYTDPFLYTFYHFQILFLSFL